MVGCAALAIAVLAVFVERSFRGVDLTDESFHAALAYRFALGDAPFRDELAVHQTAALLTLPAVWLYDRVGGGPEGLILFLRLLLVGFAALLGILIWRCLGQLLSPVGAALAAALLLVAYPGLQDFGYNMLGSGLVTASLCLGLFATAESSRWRLPASGLAAGLAVIAYPPLVLWLLFFCAELWLLLPKSKRVRPFRLFVAGATAVLLPFAALLLVIGPGYVIESIVRTNEAADKLGGLQKILGIAKYFIIRLPVLPALLAIGADRFARARPRLSGIRTPAFLLALVASSLMFVDGGHLRPLAGWPNALVSLCLLAPVLLAILRDIAAGIRRALLALWLGGAVAGLVMAYFATSNPGNFSKGGRACLLALIGAAWVVAQAEAKAACRAVRGLGVALGGLIVLFFLVALDESRRSVYRDRPLEQLTYRIREGPFAGIRTSERRYVLLSRLQEDLETFVPEMASVIFFDDLPAGFLLSRRPPGICSVWVFTRPPGLAAAARAAGREHGFRNIYVDCTRAMARTPLYAIRLAVDARQPLLPPRAPDDQDPFYRFVERCGGLITGREGFYDILRLDPSCNPADKPAQH